MNSKRTVAIAVVVMVVLAVVGCYCLNNRPLLEKSKKKDSFSSNTGKVKRIQFRVKPRLAE